MKKRLVTTAILTLVISLFFCTNVFADNIVIQGESDTVTATYGSNDITIALRARKLRVINTGTAAAGYAGYTPVIVSVTIYNLGNQNCLVNNLKFRLTSESAEYRIAGFENISPDLFISDTAYDATGYLSLKASNDYTYGGGFVVPANSNMTYVGIINVSANWISENQTWRTVDLSTATFYDNMTTTVGDYPCNAEPVDLSNIESDIDTIITTIQGIDLDSSTYLPLLVDLLSNVTYSGSNPSNLNENNSYKSVTYWLVEDNVRVIARRTILKPYYLTYDYEYNSTDDTYTAISTKRYPIVVSITVTNYTSNNYRIRYYNKISSMFPSTVVGRGFYIDYFKSDLYNSLRSESGDLWLYGAISDSSTNTYVIPPGTHDTYIQGYIDVNDDSVLSFPTFNLDSFNSGDNVVVVDGYYPINEYSILRDLYIALNPSNSTNDPDDVNTESQSINNAVESIQTAEAQYFADNQEAIENTGLSNFHFNDNQVWSLTMIVDQFEAVWNALGEFTVVYIFTLMMSLATYLIRHEPTTKIKQWRESVSAERAERTSYYGRKNAEARAHDSTMKKAIRRR